MTSSAQSLLSQLSQSDVLAARAELARRHVTDFACMVDIPTVPLTADENEDRFHHMKLASLAKHHYLLLTELQKLEAGLIDNLMVLMPPGSAKSTYVDVVFVPWFMAKQSRRNVILASYASNIAKKQGRRARQLIQTPSFQSLMNVNIKADQKAADEWALTNGSEYMAGGLLSGLTGNRSALGVLDDPIKGRAEAESQTIRDKTWEAYTDDFCSRLIPGAPQVMILTRWHEDDPAGRILPDGWDGESGVFDGKDGRVWNVLCVPAIADRIDDPLDRDLGESLWPEWFNLDHWKPFQINTRTWSSLYQQKPAPEEGSFFKKEYFKRYAATPTNLHKYMTSDHAPGGEADSDFSGVRVWGIDAIGDIYLLDGFRTQETMDKTCDKALYLIKRHKPFAWFPEDDNNWKSVAGFVTKEMRARQIFCPIHPISPHGADKTIKAQAIQAMAASGRVHIREGVEGDEIIGQYLKFPTGKYDDEVDMGSLIGRALDAAHPAIMPLPKDEGPKDSWDKAFDNDDEGEESWKTA